MLRRTKLLTAKCDRTMRLQVRSAGEIKGGRSPDGPHTTGFSPFETYANGFSSRVRRRLGASGSLGIRHVAAGFGVGDRVGREGERALFFHLLCSSHERTKSRSGERTSHAYSFYTSSL